MKKILNTALHTLLILALVAIGGLSAFSLFPIPGHVEIKIVQSGSMEPVIHTGGVVVIQPASTYSVGDIVTFGEDTKTSVPTTHRIVSVRKDGNETYFTTKGDANEDPDTNEAHASDVIGKVLFTIPYLGYLIDFARKPLGFVLLIVIPAILIILYEAVGIFEEVTKMAKKKKEERDNDIGGGPTPYDYASPIVDARIPREKRTPDMRFARMSPFQDVYLPFRTVAAVIEMPRTRYVSAFLITLMFPASIVLGNVGSTSLYFSDVERSLGNLFEAGPLDITVSPNEDVGTIGLGSANGFSITPEVSAPSLTLPFTYSVKGTAGGHTAFCNALQVDGGAPPFSYTGSPKTLTTGNTADLTPWTLAFFVPEGTTLPQGAQCEVVLTYSALQEGGLPNVEYHDDETVTILLTFDAGFVTPTIFKLQNFAAPIAPSDGDVLGSTTDAGMDTPPQDETPSPPEENSTPPQADVVQDETPPTDTPVVEEVPPADPAPVDPPPQDPVPETP